MENGANGHGSERAKSYQDFPAWQRAMDWVETVYEITADWKNDGIDLAAQVRSSALRVPAEIANGFGRGARHAFIERLEMAQGSLRECDTLFALAPNLGLMDDDTVARVRSASSELRDLIE